MVSTEMPALETSRYDGTFLLNKRSFERASKLLDKSLHDTPSEMTVDELADALWFVETAAMANGFVYDGTLPERDHGDLSEWGTSLRDATGMDKLIPDAVGLRTGPTHAEDVSFASFGLLDFLVDSSGSPRPFELTPADSDLVNRDGSPDIKGHERFKKELEYIDKSLQQTSDCDVGRLASEMAAEYRDNKRFRGSKCLAAIASLGPDASRAAIGAYASNGDVQALRVTGALINRFRLHYARQLSRRSRSIYLPTPNLMPLSIRDGKLAYQTCLEIFQREIGSTPSDVFRRDLEWNSQIPSIGLHVLLSTDVKDPAHLIAETNSFVDGYRDKWFPYLWRKAVEIERKRAGADRVDEIDADLKEFEKELQRYGQTKTKTREFLRPAIDATALGAASGVGSHFVGQSLKAWLSGWPDIAPLLQMAYVGDPFISGFVGSTVAVGQLLWRFNRDTYIDQYRDLRGAILSPGVRRDLAPQVEKVFGRNLVRSTAGLA